MSGADDLTYRLSGRVTFDNLVQIREEGEAAIVGAGDRAEIDLSGLEHGNSAAVALLMAWFRAAESLDKRIVFEAPPIELVNIVELSGLTDVLPLSGSGTAAARSELDGSQLTTSS